MRVGVRKVSALNLKYDKFVIISYLLLVNWEIGQNNFFISQEQI